MHADQLTPAEAASALGVTVATLRRWAKAGRIAEIRTVGGHRRFPRTEIDRIKAAA